MTTTTQRVQFESGETLGTVEGTGTAVANYLVKNQSGARRGRATATPGLVTNSRTVVRVTTYDPVREPMGIPAMNWDQETPTVSEAEPLPPGYQQMFAEEPKPTAPKPKKPVYVRNQTTTNETPLGLPVINWSEPPETPRNATDGGGTTQRLGVTGNADSGRTKPMGLPSMDWGKPE